MNYALALTAPAAEAVLAFTLLGQVAQLLIVVLSVLNLLIFIRALLSWFMPVGRDPYTRLLVSATEPILSPVRQLLGRVIPMQGMDLSPIAVLLLIQFLFIPVLKSIG